MSATAAEQCGLPASQRRSSRRPASIISSPSARSTTALCLCQHVVIDPAEQRDRTGCRRARSRRSAASRAGCSRPRRRKPGQQQQAEQTRRIDLLRKLGKRATAGAGIEEGSQRGEEGVHRFCRFCLLPRLPRCLQEPRRESACTEQVGIAGRMKLRVPLQTDDIAAAVQANRLDDASSAPGHRQPDPVPASDCLVMDRDGRRVAHFRIQARQSRCVVPDDVVTMRVVAACTCAAAPSTWVAMS